PVSPPPSRPVSPAAETLISSPLPRPGAGSAETIPSRTPAMNARLEAARDAAAPPPPDGASTPAPPPVPAPSALTPPPPVPDPGDGSLPNPLRDHLDSLDPLALLEKHVEAGADLEKLQVEVSKADKLAVARSVTSFSGVDTLRDLARVTVPALAVYGLND